MSAARFAPLPGVQVEVRHNSEVVYSDGRELDPSWQFVDGEGHGHFVGKAKSETLPTLEWVSFPCSMGHGDDCTSEGEWRCRLCGEVIDPGTRPARPVTITGPREYTLTLEDGVVTSTYLFGESEWEKATDTVRTALTEQLGPFLVRQEVRSR